VHLHFLCSFFCYFVIFQRLVSRRSLRHDPIFDALIAKLYPSREVYEKQQEALLTQVMQKHEFNTKTKKKQSTQKKLENSGLMPFFGSDFCTKFDPRMIFSKGDLHIILKLRHLKIGEHSSLF